MVYCINYMYYVTHMNWFPPSWLYTTSCICWPRKNLMFQDSRTEAFIVFRECSNYAQKTLKEILGFYDEHICIWIAIVCVTCYTKDILKWHINGAAKWFIILGSEARSASIMNISHNETRRLHNITLYL